MLLTQEIFLWAVGIGASLIGGLLITLLVHVIGLRGDIKPIVVFVNEVNKFFRERGLGEIFNPQRHHSLPLEKANRRDILITKGKTEGLTTPEAKELKKLLAEDALNEFSAGTISALAFNTITASTSSIVGTFSIEKFKKIREEELEEEEKS